MKKVQICACVANGYMLKCVAFRVTEDGANPPLTRNRDGPPSGLSRETTRNNIYMTISRTGWGIDVRQG